MEINIGEDEVGNGNVNNHNHIEEVSHDDKDGNCLGNGRKDPDESDALGRSKYIF